MRGPDSLPTWVTMDLRDEAEREPITAVLCPCCKGQDEQHGTRACITRAQVMTTELKGFLSTGSIPFNGFTGWCNLGENTANAPGCWRCGDAGVVSVDAETEDML